MTTNNKPITWEGKYPFLISGSGLHEDTLRIKSTHRKQEQLLKLVLPTLCITFADAKFQDSIGGEQENFPSSQAYGPLYFDPPIELNGEQEIEKFTYVRGAQKIVIDKEKIVIEFPSWRDLVIPRLRLDQKKKAEANLHMPPTDIFVDDPLKVTILQYADGRHVGGVRLEKRHPKWKPTLRKEEYNLWIRVIDGFTLKSLPEVMVDILHWDPKLPNHYGIGSFRLDDRLYTDGNGCIQIPNRPSGELEAYVVRLKDSRSVVRCIRPLADQNVRLHMRVWPMKKDTIRYTWPKGGKLDNIANCTGQSVTDILRLNRIKTPFSLNPNMRINLTCFSAIYQLEPWDTLDSVGKTFGYKDAIGLAKTNGFKTIEDLGNGTNIKLPDWHFIYANEKDTLEHIDAMFGLPKGSSITVGRVFHPDPRLPYPGETVAFPTALFAEKIKKKRK